MAYDDDQNEFPLPGGDKKPRRRSAEHLPRYFRTNVNKKFLASTIDQLIQPGTAEKLNGYYGRKQAKGFKVGDFYIGDVSKDREEYQLEPAAVIKDTLDNVNFYGDYTDYINQIKSLGGDVSDHNLLNRQEFYSWQPHIDWDKFVNFREYYWLPNGPQEIPVAGQSIDVESVYTVKVVDNGDNYGYVFTPDGQTQNPELTLYRGITYKFEINAPGNPLSFRTSKQSASKWVGKSTYYLGETVLFNGTVYISNREHLSGTTFDETFWDLDTTFNLVSQVSQQSIEDGTIEVTLDFETPDIVYYMSDNDIFASGIIRVKDIEEASFINVEEEILGKKTYTTSSNVNLSNGTKIFFQGNVTPEKYAKGSWYVEGVGSEIKLISEDELNVPSSFTQDLQVEFDNEGFDRLPYDEAIGYPINKDYITINRASKDGNLWSKYNRWFHKSVIETAEKINGQDPELDQLQRATRPIIEFSPNLKLFNFGTRVKQNIDLIDDFTKDVFSTVEGSQGYNVDGVDLTNGMRVLFTADTDVQVNGKIYEVKFITFNNTRQITLQETSDTTPVENETILCKQGNAYRGKMLWFNGTSWKLAQDKTTINQSPLFDIFDKDGVSFSNQDVYGSSTFTGTKLFSYKQGTGSNDTILGFPISYRSIENIGDITFNFDLLTDTFTYFAANTNVIEINVNSGYLRKYSGVSTFENVNGWTKAEWLSNQSVIRQYEVDNTRTFYTIDVYDQSGLIDDLWIRVLLNNELLFEGVDYSISVDEQNNSIINFIRPLNIGDIILIKTRSSAKKNDNGIYEIPMNLERNPLNKNVSELTLGEVNDHVSTIIEEVETFSGLYPGISNLRDLGNISSYGKRIVRHSSPTNIALYHLLSKESNIISSLKYARREYGKFKRLFLQTSYNLGFDGPVKDHVDLIMSTMNRDKTNSMPFYFSDMVPTGAAKKSTVEVEDADNNFFALSEAFDLTAPSDKSVQVYLNGVQLIHNKDYTFNNQGFVIITVSKNIGDVIEIYEYETTNGSFVPETPTKLGLYPKYEPVKFVDDTYLEPQEVIQGHDGSIVLAYGDYRDDLIIELEKRIYNNIKVEYNQDIFNIHDYLPSEHRNTGLSNTQIDEAMLSDFVQWLQLVDTDYTTNVDFLRENTFTFNHQGMTDPSENNVSGWWRGVYKHAYDTDRPHTHPWEMLGFTIKPTWWDEQYGSAPYTSNNLLMWEDIRDGIIRQPGTSFVVNEKYARPGLLSHLPVDEDGNLLSPVLGSYIRSYNTTELKFNFIYGDHSPVESAWRRSSEYPFALLTSLVLNQPSRVFATAFDRVRQTRNVLGHIVYNSTNDHLILDNLLFPNSYDDGSRTYTSGLVNYISNYMASTVTSNYNLYKENLKNIGNQIGFKVGGYTNKDKFKLILDSRTPLNQGNVFVPEENYKIFLNKSSPLENIYYSGVIVEKQSYGFVIKGYNQQQPYFYYNKPIVLTNDSLINVGGISQSFVTWTEDRTYSQGSIVEYENAYYRALELHTSGQTFDSVKFAKLPKLPEIGGREAHFRKKFKTEISKMSYGTVLETVQEVVDFLLGYSNYLESVGFVFDFYDNNNEFISDWKTSAKEFMFWTIQNWSEGAVITLSPGANQIKFISQYAVVDDIYDTFYGYSLLKADGKKLLPENVSLTRENPNEFIIKPKATEDGIFAVRLALVQKEHAVIIDNKTVFGDIIYDQEPGYRQDRIKVLGYRTSDWDGSLNIPGFIFDNAQVNEWQSWQDYAIGDLVKYKEFFYTARNKISGKEVFDANEWVRLDEEPEMGLIPNFEYKTNQFADFYDLDTDNFDLEQQRFAQHLIGYQNRDYLANIINDDVSQYKFYQGMIQDKGTKNALIKLFDVLSSANKDSLEFYEEWAIKVGQYGANEGFEEVEYILDEFNMRLEPQSFELVNNVTGEETDLIYRIKPYEAYLSPRDYNHAPFPSKYISDTFTKNSGFVNPDDVDFIVTTYDSILNIDFKQCDYGSTIWVGNEKLTWNVYTHLRTDLNVVEARSSGENVELVLNNTDINIDKGSIVGVFNIPNLEGFFKVEKISNNIIELANAILTEDAENINGKISILVSTRVDTFAEGSELIQDYKEGINRLWVDNDENGEWKVFQRDPAFALQQTITNLDPGNDHSYGTALSANGKNTVLVVGSPDNGDGKVFIYTRAGNASSYQLVQVIEPDQGLAKSYPSFAGNTGYNTGDIVVFNKMYYEASSSFTSTVQEIEDGVLETIDQTWSNYESNFVEISKPDDVQRFGGAVALSDDGRYLAVGSPDASNVKSTFTGNFVDSQDYAANSIVGYQNSLWKALLDIDGAETNIQFGSFSSIPQIMVNLDLIDQDDERIPVLLAGDYPFTQLNTDHFLIKAPRDMYEGSGIGDTLKLKWNTLTYAQQTNATLTAKEPFDGDISYLSSALITGSHTIVEKIDSVLYVQESNTIPLVGQTVETIGGFGEVAYTFNDGAALTIYIKNQNGSFGVIGSAQTTIGEYVGEYITVAPAEQAVGADDEWRGYWRINTSTSYFVGDTNSDDGRGLVYYDIVPNGAADPDRKYYNILDFDTSITSSYDTRNSQLSVMTYDGLPGPGGEIGEFKSSLVVLRAPNELTDSLTPASIVQGDPDNPKIDLFYNPMPAFLSGTFKDPSNIGIDIRDINKQHTVYDIWDGYIDFKITKNLGGVAIEPKVGIIVQDVTNFGTAEVVFYQKFDTDSGRIYVKGVSGDWAAGDIFLENREIQFLADGSGDLLYDPAAGFRVFGQIQARSLPLPSEGIGRMIVLDTGVLIDSQKPADAIDTTNEEYYNIFDGEYWFWQEGIVDGIPRPANAPAEGNNDWLQVYNVPASIGGTASGLVNEGMYHIYERRGVGQFVKLNSFVIPERDNNTFLGSDFKLTKFNDLYRLFVKTDGSGLGNNLGKIYVIKAGDDGNYSYSWELGTDKEYTGEFNDTRTYYENDIVYYDGVLYSAITNIAPGAFDPSNWNIITEPKEYVGYVPNDTGLLVGSDISTILDQDLLTKFARDFDTSDNGEVFAVSVEYDSNKPNLLVIYRNIGGSYYRAQSIEAPSKTTQYGFQVAMSADGKLIAVSAPYDDTFDEDQGIVYVYKQVNGEFVQSQILHSPAGDRAELFGFTLDFDGNSLIVGSKNGDSFTETTFDNNTTYFDNKFSKFREIEEDAGAIRIYERQGDTLGYAQSIDFDDSGVRYFGRNVLLSNNHIYVGLPFLNNQEGSRQGIVVDFRRPDNKYTWSILRQAKETVDINKIKRVILYNTKTNQLITNLDYIDVLQGKIPGIAEQELTYKTYYDPATYTTGSAVNVDITNSWGDAQTGQLWWDLTNAKFINPYQDSVIFSANNWNEPFSKINTIDVYEWVQSEYLPSEWDNLSGTDKGLSKGITGKSKYSDDAYVTKRIYDSASQTFKSYFYFWVGNKTTIPNIEGRNLSNRDVADLIRDPENESYRFISFISPTQFALHNCDSLIKGKDVALSIQYWTIENQDINIHNEYQIVTEGLEFSKPKRDIEAKWFDSLVGYDSANRAVPAPELSPKERYGSLNRPRQGWFVNRAEALKQLITRSNAVLKTNLIADDKDISRLTEKEQPPLITSNRYDRTVSTVSELQFVGVAKAEQAQLEPVIENGKIVRVNIINGGRGYLIAPSIQIVGNGVGGEIATEINAQGTVISATVISAGEYYNDNTRLSARRYTVLVDADETLNGKWALYERDTVAKTWIRVLSQSYNVDLYWQYEDWYDAGYGQFTEIDHLITYSFDLTSLNDSIGDVIKIENVGTGGWLLLEKINNEDNTDYSVNYKTIGRQNGTIQFKDTLYNVAESLVGYDTTSFDTLLFDSLPSVETRIILETIRDNIFIDELLIEYNNLFFASLRYVFSEQGYVDWVFKTSFIKARHNVGDLEQKINFQNDNLESYEKYIKEVKPYKTKIREYLSSYENLDNSQSMVSDFDLPPRYNPLTDSIQPQRIKIVDNQIISQDADLTTYPNKNWADNIGYEVSRIELSNNGSGYTSAPVITITGAGGSGATAVASLGRGGSISSITITNTGSGYLSQPTVLINGSIAVGGEAANAIAEIGNSSLRTMHSIVKFDRVSGVYEFTNLTTTETFTASGSTLNFNLKWPMDLKTTRVAVFVDNEEALGGQYTYSNVLDTTKGYDRHKGIVQFIDPPAVGTEIRIEYFKDINLLNAQDRINLAYEPTTDQFGKTLGQLMDGIDYGGVEVRSFEFGTTSGWDSSPWFTKGWDVYDTTFEDEIFRLDGSTIAIELSKPLEDGTEYNLYRMSYDSNGQLLDNRRMDDPDWDGSTVGTENNPQATMLPIVGDGETTTIFLDELNVPTSAEDSTEATIVIVVRKSTSDGSFIADPESYDTSISGGDLAYSSATGLNSEDINIDGDGFVTPTTSKGPEEVVPGQVLDSVNITVYEKPYGGSSIITSNSYIGDGATKIFDIGSNIVKNENLFVKVAYEILTNDQFTVDYDLNQLVFNTAPTNDARINIVNMGESSSSILDLDDFTGTGDTVEFLTSARWEDLAQAFVTVNGEEVEVSLIKSDETYEYANNFVIKFATPPATGANIKATLVSGTDDRVEKFSRVNIDTFIADGSTTEFDLAIAPFSTQPSGNYVIVKVNNTILNPGYTERFTVKENVRDYQLDLTQVPVASVNSPDIEVYLNGRQLEYLQEWTFEGAGSFDSSLLLDEQPGSTITLERGIATAGDILQVYIIRNGEYRFGYYDSADDFVRTPGTIHFDSAYSENDVITVYQFSNSDSQGIERMFFTVEEKTELTFESTRYFNFNLLERGLIELREPAKDAQYVWVVVNGELKTPSVDYKITDNKRYVEMVEPFNTGDEVQIIHFSENSVVNKFGWRQFKDMLNRTHYKRLTDVYTLAEDLNWYDRVIVLDNANGLPEPEYNAKYPGVIFIEGERIEYFSRDGNQLKQIRRGTLGTGVKEVYTVGTTIMEQGVDQTVPYKDNTEVITVTAGGYSQGSANYENSTGMGVSRITYNFNNNTAFPVRVPGVYEQICTVEGTGFTDRVKVFAGEVECTTRYISPTKLEFDVPGLPVGAYDLIIVNPFTSVPIDTPQTSFVVEGAIKSVQILLPFAPIPNPKSATNWYKSQESMGVDLIVPGRGYVIESTGTTDFTTIGAPNNNPGTEFIATGIGSGSGTVLDFVSIPYEYWEAQDIEMFVGGKRLRKTPISVYNYDAQDSPEGDITLEAEYAVNKNIGAYVRLTTPPDQGAKVNIIRKVGTLWAPEGIPLAQAETDVANFLRDKTTVLPR